MRNRVVSFVLFCAMLAQSVPSVLRNTATATGKIHIVIVEGDGAINNVRQRVAREPIVQVEDENRKPVAERCRDVPSPQSGCGRVFRKWGAQPDHHDRLTGARRCARAQAKQCERPI